MSEIKPVVYQTATERRIQKIINIRTMVHHLGVIPEYMLREIINELDEDTKQLAEQRAKATDAGKFVRYYSQDECGMQASAVIGFLCLIVGIAFCFSPGYPIPVAVVFLVAASFFFLIAGVARHDVKSVDKAKLAEMREEYNKAYADALAEMQAENERWVRDIRGLAIPVAQAHALTASEAKAVEIAETEMV